MNQTQELETNRSLFLRLMEEGFNKGNLAVVEELVSPDLREHQRGNRGGIEGVKEVIRTLRRWFPDFHMEMEDVAAVGDEVWMRFKATGTNLGSVMGHPPTGKKVSVDVIDIGKFKDGKLVEHWGVPDQLGMMLQLGLIGGGRDSRPPEK
jgi:predicted ester cyclase